MVFIKNIVQKEKKIFDMDKKGEFCSLITNYNFVSFYKFCLLKF